MPLLDFFEQHGLTQLRCAAETGLPLSTVNQVARGKRAATTGTVNRILAWARRYEPAVSYEQLFAPELAGCGKVA